MENTAGGGAAAEEEAEEEGGRGTDSGSSDSQGLWKRLKLLRRFSGAELGGELQRMLGGVTAPLPLLGVGVLLGLGTRAGPSGAMLPVGAARSDPLRA